MYYLLSNLNVNLLSSETDSTCFQMFGLLNSSWGLLLIVLLSPKTSPVQNFLRIASFSFVCTSVVTLELASASQPLIHIITCLCKL